MSNSENAVKPKAAGQACPDQGASLCSPTVVASTSSSAGIVRHIAHENDWVAVATEPDLCRLGNDIVAFCSFCTMDNPHIASPDVWARGSRVFRKGDMIHGVHADGGKHIECGTSLDTGYLQILEGHSNCKINGIPVARHDSLCRINTDKDGNGGALAKLYTAIKTISTTPIGSVKPGPEGKLVSDRLLKLKAIREELVAKQINFDAADEYIRFPELRETVQEHMKQVAGTPGTAIDYVAQVDRAVVGITTDAVSGTGELLYEGIKGVPKALQSNLTVEGQAIKSLDFLITLEEIRLGNISPASIAEDVAEIGQTIAKPVTEPWSKGQYVEAGTRALGMLLTAALTARQALRAAVASRAAKARKATDAAAKAAKEAEAKAAEDAAAVAKKNAEESPPIGGVHIAQPPPVILYKNVPFKSNLRDHLRGPDGFTQSKGINGTHNREEFLKTADDHNVVLTETPTGTPGVTEVKYKIPAKNSDQSFLVDEHNNLVYQENFFTKTVYDPKIYSDNHMFRLAQDAAASGYSNAIAKGYTTYTAKSQGVLFKIFIDESTGHVRNVIPYSGSM